MIRFLRNCAASMIYAISLAIGFVSLIIARIAKDTAEIGLRVDPDIQILKAVPGEHLDDDEEEW